MRKLTNILPVVATAIMLFMFGCDSVNSPNSNADVLSAEVSEAETHGGAIVYVDANNTSGTEDGSQASPYDTIQEGVDDAGSGDVVELLSDFTLSSQVTIRSPLTLDGNGNTIYASFSETDNDNNAGIGIIGTSDVTVSNLTVDGSSGTDLHGINVYESTGVLVSDVSLKNNARTGLVVNRSEVTAHNIRTSGHSWHGINAAKGDNVTELTVTGVSSHAEGDVPDIFVDDIDFGVTVNDPNGQYEYTTIDFRGGTAEVYTHVKSEARDACKKGGAKDFGFKNQGQCIQFVNTGKR